jgi:hypothetical protein
MTTILADNNRQNMCRLDADNHAEDLHSTPRCVLCCPPFLSVLICDQLPLQPLCELREHPRDISNA